jgi:hypothetical protein
MVRLAMLLAVLVLSACGFSPVAGPTDDGPKAPLGTAPPSAWVETRDGSHWLAYSTYCWRSSTHGTCADYAAPRCRGENAAPRIRVSRGARVRFHLGFAPKEPVGLSVVADNSARTEYTTKLDASRDPEWVVRQGGALSLFVRAKSGGDASYVACFDLG